MKAVPTGTIVVVKHSKWTLVSTKMYLCIVLPSGVQE